MLLHSKKVFATDISAVSCSRGTIPALGQTSQLSYLGLDKQGNTSFAPGTLHKLGENLPDYLVFQRFVHSILVKQRSALIVVQHIHACCASSKQRIFDYQCSTVSPL